MAEVKMTLKEYNQLHTEMEEMKEILRAVFKPQVTHERLDVIAKHGGTYYIETEVDMRNSKLRDYVDDVLFNIYDKYPFEVTESRQTFTLGFISFPTPEECPICGEKLTNETKMFCGNRAYCNNCCPQCELFNGGKCYYYEKYVKKPEIPVEPVVQVVEEKPKKKK